MGIFIKDEATDKAIRKLAKRDGKTLTAAVRDAVDKALAVEDKRPLRERIKHLQDRVAARGKTGLLADKAFYDSLEE
jgi:antitoxin VapB